MEPHPDTTPQQPALKETTEEEGAEIQAFDEQQPPEVKPRRKRTPKPKTP